VTAIDELERALFAFLDELVDAAPGTFLGRHGDRAATAVAACLEAVHELRRIRKGRRS
jgi:hypothetical protein